MAASDSLMTTQASSKQGLRLFLQQILSTGECYGVQWYKKSEKSFLIPWKHRKDPTWCEKDSEVFVAWGKFRGLFDTRRSFELSYWKQVFRSALTSATYIRELKSESKTKDSSNPYKVYQFIDNDNSLKGHVRKASKRKITNESRDMNFSVEPFQGFSSAAFLFRGKQESEISADLNVPTVVQEFSEVQHSQPTVNLMNQDQIEPSFQMTTPSYHDDNSNFDDFSEHDVFMFESQNEENDSFLRSFQETNNSSYSPRSQSEQDSTFPDDLFSETSFQEIGVVSCLPGPQQLINTMTLDMFYFHFPVKKQDINAQGARIYFGNVGQIESLRSLVEIYGRKELEQIDLPSVEKTKLFNNDLKEKNVKFVLNNMARGITLEFRNNDIYAKRYGKARVYAYNSIGTETFLDRKRDEPIKIFDFEKFKNELRRHLLNPSNEKLPSPVVYLTFGHSVSNSNDPNCLNRLPIHANIKHNEAEWLQEKLCHAHGLPSFEKDISLPNRSDEMIDFFQDLTVL